MKATRTQACASSRHESSGKGPNVRNLNPLPVRENGVHSRIYNGFLRYPSFLERSGVSFDLRWITIRNLVAHMVSREKPRRMASDEVHAIDLQKIDEDRSIGDDDSHGAGASLRSRRFCELEKLIHIHRQLLAQGPQPASTDLAAPIRLDRQPSDLRAEFDASVRL